MSKETASSMVHVYSANSSDDRKTYKGRIESWTFHRPVPGSQNFVVHGLAYDYPDPSVRQGEVIMTSLVVSVGYNGDGQAVRVETLNSRYDLGAPYVVVPEAAVVDETEDEDGSR